MLQYIDLLLYFLKSELIGVGVDRIKVLLELILVCTFGCNSGKQNNTGQKPECTNAHYSLTGTVENGTAAITPDLTSYPAGTRMTIEIAPDDGDVFSPFPVTLAALETLWWSPWTGT